MASDSPGATRSSPLLRSLPRVCTNFTLRGTGGDAGYALQVDTGEIEATEEAGSGSLAVAPFSREPAPGPWSDAAGDATPEAAVETVDGLLDEVEDALGRLDDGTYGQCSTCGGPIDDGVLADDPTSQQCAACGLPDET